jgi:PIN domain nuclease of toxin-antitoxin system
VRLLLDSHALLWWAANDARLDADARDAINSPGNEVFLSAATAWELAIKVAAGRLEVPDDLVARALREGLRPLPIDLDHATDAAALPPHHRDPFDRMLVAQARGESMTLVTADAAIRRYDVPTLAAEA